MVFPTLFQLAVKSVAQQIHNEKIPIDFNLDIKSSNAVVRELLELDPQNIEKLKTHKNQLSTVTELDLKKCKIDVEGILNLKNFKLNSLGFGDLYHLRTEYPDPSNSYGMDIVSLLEKAVNTQEKMIHLGFSGEEDKRYMVGWEKKVSKLLPSLQSIKITFSRFCQHCQLSNLCDSFPNLRILDISFATRLSTLEGIKNLKHLQKLVMRYVRIEDRDGYKELSELKNLRFLDVSGGIGPYRSISPIPVIRSLLQAEIRMENLEFLDCSMTFVWEHELKEFVEHHKSLKTVVAISTKCDKSHIPTIDLLNYNSPDSIMKSLEYAITNDREELAEDCIRFIAEKLNTNHNQLDASEISGLLKALGYVLRESKNNVANYRAIRCFAESKFFETKRFFNSFWLEIPEIVELIFKSWEHLNCSESKTTTISSILTVFKRIVDFLRSGRILQDRLMYFIMEKTVELSCQDPENTRNVTSILIKTNRFMSLEQSTVMCNNKKVIEGLFDFSYKLIRRHPTLHQQIMALIVRYLNQASENTLNYLVSNCQVVEKCYEQFMIIYQSPTKHSQRNLSQIVLKLITFVNLKDPEEKTKALMACSILSLLLAKNLIDDREYANTLLEEFNDSWGRSNILDCQNIAVLFKSIFTSKHSTDASIRFGLILMSNFINAFGCESRKYWDWMKTTSSGIRNNQKWTTSTRESALSVLYEMALIDNRWILSHYL